MRKVIAKISRTVIETAIITLEDNGDFREYIERREELDTDNIEILEIIRKV
jgi:hypothetical protein